MVTRLRASRIPALLLRHRCSVGCATGVPGVVGPARPLAVRAAGVPGAVGPADALHTGGAWCGARSGPRHLQPSRLFTADPPTNFACNSPVTISNHEF